MKLITLDKVPIGEVAYLESINTPVDLKRRLIDMGFIKDEQVMPIIQSPFANPRGYMIKGMLIAMRNEESRKINVFTE